MRQIIDVLNDLADICDNAGGMYLVHIPGAQLRSTGANTDMFISEKMGQKTAEHFLEDAVKIVKQVDVDELYESMKHHERDIEA